MKRIFIYLLLLSSFNASAQDSTQPFDGHKWEAPYHLPLPEKWTFERFLVPISFAPEIAYKGVEDIRFAPGWANKESEQYWSYTFLWWLDGKPEFNASIVAANLKAYYKGLMKVNIDTKKYNIPAEQLIATTTFQKTITANGDLETYTGTVHMLDYMQRKPITLNCLVHFKACTIEKKTVVFHELSPQPFTNKIWDEFKVLWEGFKCKK
ncbi:MAG: hypothetical protein H7Y86_08315 [Rhizobacter sp.]|nr:hypothetical protein [Ferruginibacter sp.]